MNVKRRHVPMRSCITCRTKAGKRDLLRIVAEPSGGITFDTGGKISGRGAYLCLACADRADSIRKGRLEHTLRTGIANSRWEKVVADLKAHAQAQIG